LNSGLDTDGNPVNLECYSCSSELDPNGDGPGIDGNVPCYSNPGSEFIKKCPVYANQACFLSKMMTGLPNGAAGDDFHYKGCSSFPMESDTTECNDFEYLGNTLLGTVGNMFSPGKELFIVNSN